MWFYEHLSIGMIIETVLYLVPWGLKSLFYIRKITKLTHKVRFPNRTYQDLCSVGSPQNRARHFCQNRGLRGLRGLWN